MFPEYDLNLKYIIYKHQVARAENPRYETAVDFIVLLSKTCWEQTHYDFTNEQRSDSELCDFIKVQNQPIPFDFHNAQSVQDLVSKIQSRTGYENYRYRRCRSKRRAYWIQGVPTFEAAGISLSNSKDWKCHHKVPNT